MGSPAGAGSVVQSVDRRILQGNHIEVGQRGFHNKSLHQTIAPVTPCADAQAAPAPLAGEANVDMTSPVKSESNHDLLLLAIS